MACSALIFLRTGRHQLQSVLSFLLLLSSSLCRLCFTVSIADVAGAEAPLTTSFAITSTLLRWPDYRESIRANRLILAKRFGGFPNRTPFFANRASRVGGDSRESLSRYENRFFFCKSIRANRFARILASAYPPGANPLVAEIAFPTSDDWGHTGVARCAKGMTGICRDFQ